MCSSGRHTWRNPYRRYTVIRVRTETPRGFCTGCGDRPAKYEYLLTRDSGERHWLTGLFCTSKCMKVFHEGLAFIFNT